MPSYSHTGGPTRWQVCTVSLQPVLVPRPLLCLSVHRTLGLSRFALRSQIGSSSARLRPTKAASLGTAEGLPDALRVTTEPFRLASVTLTNPAVKHGFEAPGMNFRRVICDRSGANQFVMFMAFLLVFSHRRCQAGVEYALKRS